MSRTKGEPPGKPVRASLAPAFYAARNGGWRDYWTLLHPPYTVWHLSYVLLGAAISPAPDPRIVAGALVAFGLAVGVGAHAFDARAFDSPSCHRGDRRDRVLGRLARADRRALAHQRA